MVILRFFFFSSRRRHTRWPRDWSSDVCSSDLDQLVLIERFAQLVGRLTRIRDTRCDELVQRVGRRLLCELEHREGFRRLLTTNEVDDAASLLGRDAQVAHLRLGFHRFLLPSVSETVGAPRQRRRPVPSSFSWPPNARVGATSPSLCPTIASVTNTGTCLRPSCTAIVCPRKSGTIIERRDQVLMTFFVPLSF